MTISTMNLATMTKYKLRSNFCILIISFGRADNCKTARFLKKCNYGGAWYIVCSTDDAQLEDYKKNYGERIVVYDKEEIAPIFDPMDNSGRRNLGVFARQACFPIARRLGYKYFLSLDDDYNGFEWRYLNKYQTKICGRMARNIDEMCEAMLCFLDESGAHEVDFAVGGDFVGGAQEYTLRDLLPKAMNSHFNDVDKPIRYQGLMNDDVNAYVSGWQRGKMFFSVPLVQTLMTESQQDAGGMTEAYLDIGTYVKSFYTVMLNPSACLISEMGVKARRIHHRLCWDAIQPKLLHEKWKRVTN